MDSYSVSPERTIWLKYTSCFYETSHTQLLEVDDLTRAAHTHSHTQTQTHTHTHTHTSTHRFSLNSWKLMIWLGPLRNCLLESLGLEDKQQNSFRTGSLTGHDVSSFYEVYRQTHTHTHTHLNTHTQTKHEAKRPNYYNVVFWASCWSYCLCTHCINKQTNKLLKYTWQKNKNLGWHNLAKIVVTIY